MVSIQARSDVAPPEVAMLRLLLDDPRCDPDDLDWSVLQSIAEKEGLLMRLAAWFERRHEPVPEPLATSVARARERQTWLLSLVGRIEERCARHEIPHVFLTVTSHYPDIGRDIDLLVTGRPEDVDAVLLDWSIQPPERRNLRSRLAATTAYPIAECDASLVVHHGRLGRLGEHGRFAWQLLRRRRRIRLAEVSWTAPSCEHALILQALYRLYGRPALRLRDAHWAITTLRQGSFDWDDLMAAARSAGVMAGLSCYLEYIEQIHRQVMGKPLLPLYVRERLAAGAWGRVQLRDGQYRFPATRVTGGLYLREFVADVAAGNWEAASRLFFLPVLAASASVQRLTHTPAGAR